MAKNNKSGRKTVQEIYELDWDEMSEEELELAEEMADMMFFCNGGFGNNGGC